MKIGYLVDTKRQQKQWFKDLKSEISQRGFSMVQLDTETDFEQYERKIDILIHKIADVLTSDLPQHKNFVQRLENFISKNPWMYVVDPLDAVRNILDRRIIKLKLEGLEVSCNSHKMTLPHWAYFENVESAKSCELKYPIVYKPTIADGAEISHEVGIIYNCTGFEEVKSLFPLVCEEFHNHEAVVIKLYVMGDKIDVMYRRSVENLRDIRAIKLNHASFGRISSKNSNSDAPLKLSDVNKIVNILPIESIKTLVKHIQKKLGINFFGIDIIQDSVTKNYYLIDINYMPGYYDLEDVGKVFLDYIVKQSQNRLRRDLNKSLPTITEMNRKNTFVLLDIDGTIAPKGGLVSKEMRQLLLTLQKTVTVGLITGGTLVRTKERLGDDVCSKYEWIFTENSLISYNNAALVDPKSLREVLSVQQTNEIISWVINYLSNLQLPVLRGTFVDFRNGIINISPAGRFHTPIEEKNLWTEYDKKHKIRSTMVDEMKKKFGHLNLEWVIGGEMGFDIFPRGWDKSIVLRFLNDYTNIFYFGDHTDPEEYGNDYLLFAHEKTFGFSVDGPDDTARLIKALFHL